MNKLLVRGLKHGRCFLIRPDHDADIIEQISGFLDKEGIETAAIWAIGALKEAKIAYYNQTSHEYETLSITEPVELVSFIGNATLRDGKPFLHAHAALAFRDGRAVGGHLTAGRVFAAEVFLQELAGRPLVREHDSVTGLYLWGQQ